MKNIVKKRNPIAYDLMTNGLYKPKVIKNKKKYDRKKLKNGKELLKNLSHYFYLIKVAQSNIISTLLRHPLPYVCQVDNAFKNSILLSLKSQDNCCNFS